MFNHFASIGSRSVVIRKEDAVLHDIAQLFTRLQDVIALASLLLDGVGTGGWDFVHMHWLPGGVPDPKYVAQSVLQEWARSCPRKCHGEYLLGVLREVHAYAAEKFETRLVPSKDCDGGE